MRTNRVISMLLCFAFCFSLLSIPASAVSHTGSSTASNAVISDRAGKSGSYYYDVDLGTELFVPSDATLEDMWIESREICGDSIQPYLQSCDSSLAEIDPELDKILESYLATDHRFAVTNPSGYERSTCLLGARFDDAGVTHVESGEKCSTGVHIGTGWLINNTYLVTAGHLVYDWEHSNNGNDGYAKHVAIYVGASNGNYVHYSLSVGYSVGGDYRDCTSESDYQSTGRFDDWAVIELKTPVPASKSISKLTPKQTDHYSEMLNKSYTTQGYPADRNTGKDWKKYTMYKQTNCTISGAHYPTPYILDVAVSSNTNFYGGQSGSPIYKDGYAQGIGVGKYLGDTCFILINRWLYEFLRDNCS
ncbi:hypothetical protein D7X94_17655 [Acutalibacter sp. 1XD8-33]|uniref:trypsin-like serine peptidase n=1 Tax=Acutalibacter sp. 1XD8-33 TaxID=2320081 RepID=UPI000EA3856D|nr:trypsin-like serine protease [Acutalibacter sp. 1XD8-33]RKJ38115.1 hypothetical protein D7X94_17655 [Acutalibacter sp. 1XD8-33]